MSLDTSFLAGRELAVYTAAWCPDCRRLKRWLAGTDIQSHDVDIESVEGAAEKLEEETGKRAIPFVLLDGQQWVRGYHKELPQRFDAQLFLSELRAAASQSRSG